jgi:hypothetical protein
MIKFENSSTSVTPRGKVQFLENKSGMKLESIERKIQLRTMSMRFVVMKFHGMICVLTMPQQRRGFSTNDVSLIASMEINSVSRSVCITREVQISDALGKMID